MTWPKPWMLTLVGLISPADVAGEHGVGDADDGGAGRHLRVAADGDAEPAGGAVEDDLVEDELLAEADGEEALVEGDADGLGPDLVAVDLGVVDGEGDVLGAVDGRGRWRRRVGPGG